MCVFDGNNRRASGVEQCVEPPSSAPSAFEQFVLPHLDCAFDLARWLLRHDHDAEDAVQEACVKAHRALPRFRAADGRSWLLTIVRNVCYSRLRQVRGASAPEAFDDEVHSGGDAPAELAALEWREEQLGQLRAGVERLPPEFREVIVLHELEGLTYREIAEVAAIPIGTVMSRLSRARKKLQADLLRAGHSAPGREERGREEPTHGL
jgi:RNA polymerase sigma-70 factor (ECF subfamily)